VKYHLLDGITVLGKELPKEAPLGCQDILSQYLLSEGHSLGYISILIDLSGGSSQRSPVSGPYSGGSPQGAVWGLYFPVASAATHSSGGAPSKPARSH
jgi:hypothetical protein